MFPTVTSALINRKKDMADHASGSPESPWSPDDKRLASPFCEINHQVRFTISKPTRCTHSLTFSHRRVRRRRPRYQRAPLPCVLRHPPTLTQASQFKMPPFCPAVRGLHIRTPSLITPAMAKRPWAVPEGWNAYQM